MIESNYDVVVIGGGPGGSTASTLLAKKGYKVALLEKQEHPRYTVGESLIPHFWRYTDMLGASEAIESANFIKKNGGLVCWDGKLRSMQLSNFGFKRPGLHVERDIFDDILFRNAREKGVDTFENTQALEIRTLGPGKSLVTYSFKAEDGTTQKGSVSASYVIDSTGQATLMGKKEDMKVYDDGFRFHAFWGYFKSMKYMSSLDKLCAFDERREHHPQTLVTNVGEWGWIWQIVLQDSVSVGLIVERDHMDDFKSRGDDLSSRFINSIKEIPIISNLMDSAELIDDKIYSVRDYSYKTEEHAIDNTLLVGDAAAFVDPINSAGVIMAFYSGYFASWVIDKSLQHPEKASNYFKLYNEIVSSKFNLFRAIAVPEKEIPEETLNACRTAFKQLSENELQLLMTQLSLTQRAENIPAFLRSLGVDKDDRFKEMTMDTFMERHAPVS